ncbi:MAG: system, galactitol-specific component [Bacillota bacterium]|jgi:PTS system galactitol-specific IIC component|nr:system, galactitol-specific component [Bacillota bacterium]
MEILQSFLSLGASAVMPVIILIIGLIFGMKFKKAFMSGITVGIGFIGINLVAGLLMGTIMAPLINTLTENWNLSLSTVDMGWPLASGIAFSTGTLVLIMFAVLIILNIVMMALKLTTTLNVDIWNFWHFIMFAAFGHILTGSLVLGCIIGAAYCAITLLLSGRISGSIAKFTGVEGLTITAVGFPVAYYICYAVDRIVDRIPGINKINFNLKSVPEKYAFLTEPSIIGIFVGVILSLLAKYPVNNVILTSIQLGAVMYIMPRMVKILMEGLAPITEAAGDFMNDRFPGRKVDIAIDCAALAGDTELLTISTIMVPVTLLLAVVLPFNTVLPIGDLPALVYMLAPAIVAANRNSFRAIINSLVIIVIFLFIASDLAPLATGVAQATGIVKDQGMVSCLTFGNEHIGYVLLKLTELIQSFK